MVRRAGGALLNMIAIDPAADRTIASQIAAAVRKAILAGDLRPGERLPATRLLSRELSVARSTVVEAFEQLGSEGLIRTAVGSGSFVATLPVDLPEAAPPSPPRLPQPERLARLMQTARQQLAQRIAHVPRAFTTAMPAFDVFPMALWSRLLARHWQGDRAAALGYGDPLGHPALRAAIARHLRANRGVSCDASQVFVMAGAQQAFQLIAAMLVDPGEAVWFEDPGAIGARNCFVVHGARVVPVPVDGDGLCVADGLSAAPDFRLAFTTPSHQQPLGVRMSHERRVSLLAASVQSEAFIVEDDWDGDFTLSGRPQPALKALDAAGRVIYVASFSKTMFPALRLGYLVAPAALVPTFEVALRAYSAGVPTSLQAAVAAFIDEGHYAAHIRRMRRLYAERQTALLAAAPALARWMEVVPTPTGMHAVAWLVPGLSGEAVARIAEAQNLTVAPLARFCLAPFPREGVLLGFSGVPSAQIEDGVRRLAAALAA
jgi:GntR family transcriptional regulator/MocR family aminotransferase